jgi:hypothetical protein
MLEFHLSADGSGGCDEYDVYDEYYHLSPDGGGELARFKKTLPQRPLHNSSTTSSYGTIIPAHRSPSNPCSSTTLQWRLTSRSWLSPSILNPRSSLQSSLLARRHPVLSTCSMSGNSGLNPFRPHSSLTLARFSV